MKTKCPKCGAWIHIAREPVWMGDEVKCPSCAIVYEIELEERVVITIRPILPVSARSLVAEEVKLYHDEYKDTKNETL